MQKHCLSSIFYNNAFEISVLLENSLTISYWNLRLGLESHLGEIHPNRVGDSTQLAPHYL